jgi:predicted amidohydrolase
MYTEQWQIEQNFKRTVEALEEAADRGAVLALTPDVSFTDTDSQMTKNSSINECSKTQAQKQESSVSFPRQETRLSATPD